MIQLAIALWLVSGAGSFIYWWTKDFNYTADEVVITLVISLLGPLAFVIGFLTHGRRTPRVLIRRRGR